MPGGDGAGEVPEAGPSTGTVTLFPALRRAELRGGEDTGAAGPRDAGNKVLIR